MQKFMAAAAVLAGVLCAFSHKALAQATDGNLTGIVLDASGAAIPNASVEAENVDTGVKYSSMAGAGGVYRINNVPVGTYAVTANAAGFTRQRLERVIVELNRTTTANFTLQIGDVAESITVSEAATAVDTTTAQVQSTYTTRQVIDLPITAHSLGPLNLSLLSAGVASSGGYGLGEGPSVGGQRPRNNSFNIEGIDNNRKDVTGSNVRVPNEAVAEFTLLQNQFSAEFGHAGGGIFNTVVKSGTNEFHGSAYNYFQNRYLNALDEADRRQGILERQRFDDNRFGGTVGGPIVRNKLFFFGNFEYNPIGYASSPASPTFTPTEQGYQALASISGLSRTNLDVLRQYAPPAPSSSATTTISGQEIPIGILPIVIPAYQNNRSWIVSIDYNISDNDQIRGRYIDNYTTGIDASVVPNLPAFMEARMNKGKMAMLTYNHVFSPNLTNELRLGYNRYEDEIPIGDQQFPGLDMFPNIEIQEDLNLQMGPFTTAPQSGVINTYQIANNLNLITGSHVLKFGVDARRYIAPTNFIQRVRGDYAYSNLERYLLDLSPDVLIERNLGGAPYSGNSTNFYAFVNDEWKVRRDLTLNLGLRYEFKGIPRDDRLQRLNAVSSVPGLLEFREPQAEKKNFAPRVGIAWSPGGSATTSVRAGFGMAYDNYFDNLGTLSKPPQLEQTVKLDPNDETMGFLAGGGINPNLRPAQLSPEEAKSATSTYIPDQNLPYSMQWNVSVQRAFAQDYTAEVRYLGSRGVNLFTQHWLNVISPVRPDHSLPVYLNRPSQAELDAAPLTLAQLRSENIIEPTFDAAGFNENIITVFDNRGNSIYHGLAAELTRRFSRGLLFKGAYTWSKLIDDSTADLFSTLLSPRRPQDFYNMRNERGRSFLDRTHRFTLSWVWDTPFLKDPDRNWFLRNVVGNWIFGGVYTYESPQYATVQSNVDANLNIDAAGDRAVVNPAGQEGVGSGVTPLNNSAGDVVGYLATNPNARYISAAPGVFPNAGRNTLPMRPINNVDVNLTKQFNITERVRFQIRGLFLNALNHPQYTPGYVNSVLFKDSNTTRNHLIPSHPWFNDPSQVFNSNSRTIQIVGRLTF